MDITLYTTKADSAALVTEKTSLSPSDLDTLLDVSAGTLNGQTVYRPYFVSAKLLANRRVQIAQAEGAVFVDPLKVARELLETQRSIDLSLGLVVPSGSEAVPSLLWPRFPAAAQAENNGVW